MAAKMIKFGVRNDGDINIAIALGEHFLKRIYNGARRTRIGHYFYVPRKNDKFAVSLADIQKIFMCLTDAALRENNEPKVRINRNKRRYDDKRKCVKLFERAHGSMPAREPREPYENIKTRRIK